MVWGVWGTVWGAGRAGRAGCVEGRAWWATDVDALADGGAEGWPEPRLLLRPMPVTRSVAFMVHRVRANISA